MTTRPTNQKRHAGVDAVPVDSHGVQQPIVLTIRPLRALFLAPDNG